MNCLLFDLDGTLSDPIEGIWKSLNHALECLGYKPRRKEEVAPLIGPPLDVSFPLLTGSTATKEKEKFISCYREFFADTGYAQNRIYPGIKEMLSGLTDSGFRLGLCTYKKTDLAEKVLATFDIAHHFQFVSGGIIGTTKTEQITTLLKDGLIDRTAVMIGDRAGDIQAAHSNGLTAAGVLWGYGSKQELLAESPAYLFDKPSELNAFNSSFDTTRFREE